MHMLGYRWTLADVHQEVRHGIRQHNDLRTWLRDEEVNASVAAAPVLADFSRRHEGTYGLRSRLGEGAGYLDHPVETGHLEHPAQVGLGQH
jgi:hypothetical protein